MDDRITIPSKLMFKLFSACSDKMPSSNFSIQAAQIEDISALAQLSADAFELDRHTEMKGLGKEPFDMKNHTLESMPGLLRHPRCVILKAVHKSSGNIMGYCTWGFRGFAPSEMPVIEGRSQPAEETKKQDVKEGVSESPTATETHPENTDPIKHLEALTDADLHAWMTEVMPEGTRCIYVIGLSVSPRYQGQGVGSALLRFGIDFCNREGVFAWVHSSEPAWRMYEKSGFQTVRSLDIDLDEYAPMPPPNEGTEAKWGHYVFRYMKYTPWAD